MLLLSAYDKGPHVLKRIQCARLDSSLLTNWRNRWYVLRRRKHRSTEHFLNGVTSITYVGLSKAPRVGFMLEAERRGILRPEKVAELDGARKLGLLVNKSAKE